jgi:hypothetical protein
VEQQGRHRYFSLTNPAIAQALEHLAVVAPASPIRSLRASEIAKAVRSARMCYNHLAGKLGVVLAEALVEKEILTNVDGGYLITEAGERWLQEMGIECSALRQHGQMFAPYHIDWSERLHHVAGALGAALARRFFELDWVKRTPMSRAVRLTETGEQALLTELGLHLKEEKASLSA